jgi:phosphatidylserine/phosphatidylglycerophosphate/cardiolipin synthase-like enzyme
MYTDYMAIVQSPKQFLTDFMEHAKHAKKRIYLQSMLFEAGDTLTSLKPILLGKANEGVDVQLTIDWVWQKYVHADPDVLPVFNKKKRIFHHALHQQTMQLIKELSDAGITVTITNTPNPLAAKLPIFRRNHTKLYLIDDDFVWVGGVNLLDSALTWIDFMVRYTDPSIVQSLAEQFHKVNNNRPKNNYTLEFGSETKLLVDAGVIGNSLIYNEATEQIKKARKSILFASQFVADGKLLDEMIKAHERGATVTLLTSNKEDRTFNTFPYNGPYKKFLEKTKHIPLALIHQNTKLHVKLLIIDDQTAIFGSHNLVHLGTILGTEEIAIQTKDEKLVKELREFIEAHTSPH